MIPNIQFYISPEVAGSIIAAIGVGLSALVSRQIALHTSKTEIQKLKMTWEREDSVLVDADFSDMVELVIQYNIADNLDNQRDALQKISAVKLKSDDELCEILDRLYTLVTGRSSSDINSVLSEAIEQKRKSKSNH